MNTCPRCRRAYADGVRFCATDGAQLASVLDPYLGRVLMGQFKLVGFAGRGAMGTVYRAEQINVARTVAVKVLRGDLLVDDGAVKRFLREARAAARLQHPNIVSVHLVGETDDGMPFIVMEYVEGRTLGALCDELGAIECRRALRLARQIASALNEAHAKGIVHRDLKAENILLAARASPRSTGGGDVVKVLDFGIAKLLEGEGGEIAQLTRSGTIFGTPHYIAPEQASGQDVDGRADLYSLGVILFRMVVGELPFDGESGMQVLMRHVRELPPRPRDLRPDVPEPVEALILTALQKNRERRFADAERFIAAIDSVDNLLGGEPGQTLLGLAPLRGEARFERTDKVVPLPLATPPAVDAAATTAPRVAADQLAAARAAECGADTWAARDSDEDGAYDDEVVGGLPRHRVRGPLIASGALLLAVAAFVVAQHGDNVRPAATVAAAAVPHPAAAPTAPTLPPRPPLVEEHVASAGNFVMRAGFESAPLAGRESAMRVLVEDGSGHAVLGATVAVGVRGPSERDELFAAQPDGDHYRADVSFRAPGRHAVWVHATPPAGRRIAVDFEVDAEGPGGVVARVPVADPQRAARARRPGSNSAPLRGESELDMPVTIIPGSSSARDPMVPRALGPAPEAPAAAPDPEPLAPVPSTGDPDPYESLRESK